MNTLWLVPALLCYALSTTGFILARTSSFRGRWSQYSTVLLGAGAIFHALDLIATGLLAGNIPVTNLAQSLSFLAWLTALIGLVLIVWFGMTVIGVFAAPSVLVVGSVASLMMKSGRFVIPKTLRSAWLPVHVTLAFLGDALFVLAAVVSVVYLLYESRLKAKRPMGAPDEAAPSLEKLDRINYRLLAWGFLMLSLAIITGSIWADATWGHFWSWEPQESLSLVTWLLYAGLLESRLTVGWRGRRAAALTIVLFAVLVGSFLGVSLVAPGKHGGSFG
jgi:cytochrome c-type biogenesis protein CcsB